MPPEAIFGYQAYCKAFSQLLPTSTTISPLLAQSAQLIQHMKHGTSLPLS